MSDPVAKFQVLITDRFDLAALALLQSDSAISVRQSAGPVPTPEELESCEGLIIRSRTKADELLLSRAPRLKVIVTATSGYDHIDFAATGSRQIAVMHTPEANAASACELTWALILACARRVIQAHRAVKAGEWRREALIGHELSGKTLGIIGLGRIGSRVARVASAFGMKVAAFDPYKDDAHFASLGASRWSFDELLKVSDVISFHVPATEETRYMLERMHFQESMSHSPILINTSRGAVFRERDLLEALHQNRLASCGLDVYEREPLPRQSDLLKFDNVVLSPHLGATTHEAFSAASRQAAEKMRAFVARGEITDRLPQRSYCGHRPAKS